MNTERNYQYISNNGVLFSASSVKTIDIVKTMDVFSLKTMPIKCVLSN